MSKKNKNSNPFVAMIESAPERLNVTKMRKRILQAINSTAKQVKNLKPIKTRGVKQMLQQFDRNLKMQYTVKLARIFSRSDSLMKRDFEESMKFYNIYSKQLNSLIRSVKARDFKVYNTPYGPMHPTLESLFHFEVTRDFKLTEATRLNVVFMEVLARKCQDGNVNPGLILRQFIEKGWTLDEVYNMIDSEASNSDSDYFYEGIEDLVDDLIEEVIDEEIEGSNKFNSRMNDYFNMQNQTAKVNQQFNKIKKKHK